MFLVEFDEENLQKSRVDVGEQVVLTPLIPVSQCLESVRASVTYLDAEGVECLRIVRPANPILAGRFVKSICFWKRSPVKSSDYGIATSAGISVSMISTTLGYINFTRARPSAVFIAFGHHPLSLLAPAQSDRGPGALVSIPFESVLTYKLQAITSFPVASSRQLRPSHI